jgi:hypothetical protein
MDDCETVLKFNKALERLSVARFMQSETAEALNQFNESAQKTEVKFRGARCEIRQSGLTDLLQHLISVALLIRQSLRCSLVTLFS